MCRCEPYPEVHECIDKGKVRALCLVDLVGPDEQRHRQDAHEENGRRRPVPPGESLLTAHPFFVCPVSGFHLGPLNWKDSLPETRAEWGPLPANAPERDRQVLLCVQR